MEYFLYALYGIIIGFIGGYGGISGAPILIVFLTTISGFTQHMAQGTSLSVMLGPMSLTGVYYLRNTLKGYWKHVLWGFVSYAGFSYLGGWLAYRFSSTSLRDIFSIFIVFIGIIYIYRALKKDIQGNKECRVLHVAVLSMFVGTIGGFLGIGAGVLFVPILSGMMHVEKNLARAISLAILLPPVSIGAVIKYSQMGDVNWVAAVIIFFSYLVTNYIGAHIGSKHSHKKFAILFGIFLSLIGIINIFI